MDQKTTSAPWGRIPPALDLRKLFDRLDLSQTGRKILDAQRKDVEALIEANREAYRTFEAVGRRQQEMLRSAFEAWQDGTREVIDAPKLADKAQATLRRSQQAFGRALTDLRSLSELVLESNRRVLGLIDERAKARLSESGQRAAKARTPFEPVPEDSPKASPPSRRKTAPPPARPARATRPARAVA